MYVQDFILAVIWAPTGILGLLQKEGPLQGQLYAVLNVDSERR